MMEMLTPIESSECENCGGPITRYRGDLGSDHWGHDDAPSGGLSEPCPGFEVAAPAPDKTEPVTDVQAHYRAMRETRTTDATSRTGAGASERDPLQ